MITTEGRLFIRILVPVLALASHAVLAAPLEVFPTQPSCLYETTLKVNGDFPDSCFVVEDITLIENPPTFTFAVHVVDYWGPQSSCLTVIVPYSAHETVGPLPGGSYTLIRDEIVESQRYPGFDWTIFFDVACCEPLPSPVTDLRLGRGESTWELVFTWTDVDDADSYSIYYDGEANGAFANLAGIVPSGENGVEVGAGTFSQFFLVSGNNACGSGNPRDNGE